MKETLDRPLASLLGMGGNMRSKERPIFDPFRLDLSGSLKISGLVHSSTTPN